MSEESCNVVGCIGHLITPFACIQPGDTKGDSKTQFKARVHFTNSEDILSHATESVKRILQQKWARAGKFPIGRIVDVDSRGNFQKTPEESMIDITSTLGLMSPEVRAAWFKEQLRLTELHMDTLREITKDDPQVVKVKRT